MVLPIGLAALALSLLAPGRLGAANLSEGSGDIPTLTYSLVKTWPHDPNAFTEGLVFWNGMLIESTGLYGQSTLRKVDLESGRVIQEVKLPDRYFGEGIAVLNGKIFQLTWQAHRGLIYNVKDLKPEGEFSFTGEGWGLTTDGHLLIMSDGTSQIRFIDPDTFKVVRTIDVSAHGQPVDMLNELELVNGTLYANVWKTKFVIEIDPANGRILASIDFVGLLAQADYAKNTDVMNGIAYDPKGDRLYVTGKNWPRLFEVKVNGTAK